MTIKQLLNCSVEQLEAMSDIELQQYCAPFLRVVEIKEVVEEPTVKQPSGPRKKKTTSDWLKEAEALAKRHGVTLELPQELKLK